MYKSLIIAPELKLHLELLSFIDKEFPTDLIMALIETINGIEQYSDDMPIPVRQCYLYWMDGRLASIIKVE